MRDVEFVGSSHDHLRAFPQVARQRAGYQLHLVQSGQVLSDWKPMATVGPGCREARIRDAGDAYRGDAVTIKGYASVWDALEDTPGEAENLKIRSTLMQELTAHITRAGMTQSAAAQQFGVTQPRISDLMRGKIDLFSIDTLVNMLAAAGLKVDLRVRQAR